MRLRIQSAEPYVPTSDGAGPEACVTCGRDVATRYCSHCGEMRASEREYSVLAFIKEHVLEAMVSLDGRVLRTAKMLIRRPGELTAAFMRGSRVPYLPPLQCFLLFNVVFFIWSSATQAGVLDTPLSVHLHGMPYSETARPLVIAKLRATGMSQDAFAAKFNAVGSTQARSLVLVMVPMFAIVTGLVTFILVRRRRPVVQHVVYALHTYSYFFVAMPVMLYVIGIPATILLRWMHVKPGPYGYDDEISLLMLLGLAAYLALSLRRAYALGVWRSVAGATICMLGVAEIVQLYRHLLFYVTLRSM